jgi:hypothetical protein
MFTVSNDGYVRCRCNLLLSAGLTHVISGLDDEAGSRIPDTVLCAAITGYTEWVDSTASVVTVGWDWQMNAVHRMVALNRSSEPRSNIMFVDANGADIGLAKTARLLGDLIDAFDWQSVVRQSVANRYAGRRSSAR